MNEQAHQEGRDDFKKGLDFEDNPYIEATDGWRWWRAGWYAAQEESQQLTVKQLIEARQELESLMLDALTHFAKQTGMPVQRIEYRLRDSVQTIGPEEYSAELKVLI